MKHPDAITGTNPAEALRRSEERLRTVMDASADGFWDRDLVTGRVFHSARMNEMVGLPPADEVADTEWWRARVCPEDMVRLAPEYERVLRGQQERIDATYRVRCEDGSWKWIRSRAKVIARDAVGAPVRIAGVVTDVTAQKHLEDALRASEDRFRQLANEIPVGIYQTGPKGDIQFVNPAWMKITGLSEAEAFGPDAGKAIHAEDRDRVTRLWQSAICSGEAFSGEYRLRSRDGKEVWVRGFGTAVRDRSGIAASYVGALIDISDARRLQGEIAQASRLAAMGTLVAGVAHEINNPLAATLANLGLVLELARGAREDIQAHRSDGELGLRELNEIIEVLAEAQESGHRIAQIVRDMATFANPNPKRTLVRLTDVVQGAMRWVPVLTGQPVRIEIEDEGAPAVMAASGQLEQVVHNLITNAARASPENSGIVVRTGPGSPGMARLEVIDHGVGIPNEDFNRIFEPFYTTRRAGDGRGAGLGLAITRAIVVAHGGTISVTSEVEKGSTFCMELPVAPVEP